MIDHIEEDSRNVVSSETKQCFAMVSCFSITSIVVVLGNGRGRGRSFDAQTEISHFFNRRDRSNPQ